jgi:two-component system, NarL family, sensor histidine kinase DesK
MTERIAAEHPSDGSPAQHGTADDPSAVPFDATSHASRTRQRRSGKRTWHDWLFPGIWLIYLAQTVHGVHKYSDGVAAVAGYVLVGVFALCYLNTLNEAWDRSRRRLFWIGYAALFVITGVELFLARQDAPPMLIYVTVVTVAAFQRRSLLLVAGLTVIGASAPTLVPSWHAGFDWDMAITLPLVGLAMWGFFQILRSNIELTHARAEVARLAAENERSRIARDLHDLLGHSLTTITVKAELAKRLAGRDPVRATSEIAEVEALSRRTLSEVRAAVAGYREVTLGGELATGRQVLRAAGFVADLPKAVDDVDPNYDELFGWVVREGVTNVVRHSRGTSCTVTAGRDWLEITDDGIGTGPVDAGSGLTGLRERVEAAGGTVTSGRDDGARGWRLRVDLPPNAAAAAPAGHSDAERTAP